MNFQRLVLRSLFFASIAGVLALTNLFVSKTLAADGQLDTSFTTAVNLFGSAGEVYQLETDASGKIYVGGNFNLINNSGVKSLARLNSDGSLDTTFAPGNDANTITRAFALQADGKIIFAGSYSFTSQIVRLNTNGTLDSSFTPYSLGALPPEYVDEIAVQPDGKILVAGVNASLQGYVIRLNTNGTLDTSFNLTNNSNAITAIAVQPDGKILIGGNFTVVGGQNRYTITRLNADGSLDTSFNAGQAGTGAPSGAPANARDILVAPNGKIYFEQNGATTYNGVPIQFRIVRLNSDGTLDTSYVGAFNAVSPQGYNHELALGSDGKLFAVGALFNTNYASGVVKLNLDGSVDTTFAPSGTYNGNRVNSVALQADGKIVIGGNFTQFESVNKLSIARLQNTVSLNNSALRIADFDGDTKSDISVFRSGTWFVNPSSNPSFAPTATYQIQWGLSSDIPTPADFDGDGKSDIAVWRGSNGTFYILNSQSNTVRVEQFGQSGDNPTVSGDWDGDGKADLAVYRAGAQSIFYYRGSLNNPNGNTTFLPWGTSGDAPIFGDFDGDKKLDVCVYRPSNNTFYVRQSLSNAVKVQPWGNSATDAIFAGDFDGDGKSDFAVQRFSGADAGNWYVLTSATNSAQIIQWGLGSDLPVPADYDGDGRMDFAVFRRANGTWYIRQSASNLVKIQQFGATSDFPLPLNYVR